MNKVGPIYRKNHSVYVPTRVYFSLLMYIVSYDHKTNKK